MAESVAGAGEASSGDGSQVEIQLPLEVQGPTGIGQIGKAHAGPDGERLEPSGEDFYEISMQEPVYANPKEDPFYSPTDILWDKLDLEADILERIVITDGVRENPRNIREVLAPFKDFTYSAYVNRKTGQIVVRFDDGSFRYTDGHFEGVDTYEWDEFAKSFTKETISFERKGESGEFLVSNSSRNQ